MKVVLALTVVLVGLMIALQTALRNGSVLRYIDTHPDSNQIPRLATYIGQGYYLFGDLENSATYYWRVAERYPQSPYADEAYFSYLRCLDDMNTPRMQMADLYLTYLDRFPKGKYSELARKRSEIYRNLR